MHALQCPDADNWNFLRNIVVFSPVWNTTRRLFSCLIIFLSLASRYYDDRAFGQQQFLRNIQNVRTNNPRSDYGCCHATRWDLGAMEEKYLGQR